MNRWAQQFRLAPLSVLVIDDDPDVRGFIVDSLEEQGYRVREASDGREGLAAQSSARRQTLSSSISSCPGLSGAEVARQIRGKSARPANPVCLRLQRDRSGQTDRARRASACEAFPGRSTAESGAQGADDRQLNARFD